ncbi:MAG: DNA/RNA non-specific endonuclease [Coriobacteriales bacterium]|jgi:DNA-entry nuclease
MAIKRTASHYGLIALFVVLIIVGIVTGSGSCSENQQAADSSGSASEQTSTASSDSAANVSYTWDENAAPDYYLVTGTAQVKDAPAKGTITYSKLDRLGRTRTAVGTITYQRVEESAGWREEIKPEANPSGWGHNGRARIALSTGGYYTGYFWNRSHLIADSLGGHAVRRNLVTGTRMQNVGANETDGGMAYCETKVRNWLYKHHKGSVYYRAEPIYRKKELVCRVVVVDMKSSDASIDEHVIVYNAAKGYEIDYKTGTFRESIAASQ